MYTYKLHKSNATPVLSSRTHLGAHKRAAPFPSMFSCQGEEGNIGMLVWGGGAGGRRGREGGRGEGEGGGRRGGGEGGGRAGKGVGPLEDAKLHRLTLGLIYWLGGGHWGGD